MTALRRLLACSQLGALFNASKYLVAVQLIAVAAGSSAAVPSTSSLNPAAAPDYLLDKSPRRDGCEMSCNDLTCNKLIGFQSEAPHVTSS